ncbi:MAG: hypothetical protein J6Z31_05735 [Fibrobacter sp.]|nr:hypothetical protein [Fibrobacter sp.]
MKKIACALRLLGSLQFGLILFIALFALIFWGTLFEAKAGVEFGTARFFDAWWILVAGVLPFPALKTLALLLFLNVLCTCIFRIPHTWKKFGLLLVHISILVLIGGSFASSWSRASFAKFGLEGGTVLIDPTEGASFQILDGDSAGATIVRGDVGDTVSLEWNSPQKVCGYTVYFGEFFPMTEEKFALQFFIKRDPFAFVPYLFSGLLFVGLIWHLACTLGGRKR